MIRITKKHYAILSTVALVVLVTPHLAFADWGSPVQEVLYNLVVNLFGLLVRIGGALLDYSIDNFVLGFGDTFAHSGIGVAVNNGWVVIRDSINLFFIFGLVYIGIRMILDSDNSNMRRWLANLILAALLINFSLFATKMVIDFSNQISAEIAVAGLGASDMGNGKYESHISTNMMGQLGLSNAFQLASKPAGAGYGYIFGLAILFMITAFVFGAGGILLIIRFAVLNLFLVFSSVMFLSWVLPGLSDTMDKYWKGFLKRAFFAPIFFLFLYFAFQMVGELQKTVKGGLASSQSLAGGLGGDAAANPASIQDATLGTIPFFFLVCIFMIIALVAAQKIGADGAGKAVSIGKSWGNKVRSGVQKGAGSATFGAGASLGRNTVGRYANRAMDGDTALGKRFRTLAANSKSGQYAYNAVKKTSESSFDARRVGGLGKSLGIGEGQKGGFAQTVKDEKKARDAYTKFLGETDVKSPEGIVKVDNKKPEVKAREEAKKKALEEKAESEKRVKELVERYTSSTNPEALAEYAKSKQAERETKQQEIESMRATITTDPTLTPEQKVGVATRVKMLETELAAFEKREAEAKKAAGIAGNQKGLKDEMAELKRQEWAANQSGDDKAFTKARDDQKKKQAELDNISKSLDTEINSLKLAADAVKTDDATIKNIAEAEVKFEKQISYMAKLQEQQSFWNKTSTKLFSGLGGAGSAAIIGGAGLGYGAVGGAAAAGRSERLEIAIRDMDKTYGKGGVKTVQESTRKKNLADLANELPKEDGDKK